MITNIPYPIASIVEYKEKGRKPKKYLVKAISLCELDYSITGSKDLESEGLGTAWVNYGDLYYIILI